MKKIFLAVVICALSLSTFAQTKTEASNKSKKVKIKLNTEYTTESGLKYKITEKDKGAQVLKGDKVTVHYTGTLTNGTKFDSSKDRNQPFSFKVGSGQVIKGWDEGLALLNVGDKATLIIPPAIGYGERAVGSIPANSTLNFDIEVIDTKTAPSAKPYEVAGKDTVKMQSGLKFIKVASGTGAKPALGSTVSVHYTGYLMDGKIFDSSIERDEPIEFQIGRGMVIKGWEEGIALMQVGDKMRLIIPSELAYGPSGAGGVIPPNATLIFDVELVNVK